MNDLMIWHRLFHNSTTIVYFPFTLELRTGGLSDYHAHSKKCHH